MEKFYHTFGAFASGARRQSTLKKTTPAASAWNEQGALYSSASATWIQRRVSRSTYIKKRSLSPFFFTSYTAEYNDNALIWEINGQNGKNI